MFTHVVPGASERTSEKREDKRGNLKTECYFISDRMFVDVVTFRIDKMQKDIRKLEQNKASDIAYSCSNCGATVGTVVSSSHLWPNCSYLMFVQYTEDAAFSAMVSRGVDNTAEFFCVACEQPLQSVRPCDPVFRATPDVLCCCGGYGCDRPSWRLLGLLLPSCPTRSASGGHVCVRPAFALLTCVACVPDE